MALRTLDGALGHVILILGSSAVYCGINAPLDWNVCAGHFGIRTPIGRKLQEGSISLRKGTFSVYMQASISMLIFHGVRFILLKPYFTVTLIFTLFDPDFTVIVAVPFFFAVILPFEFTVATFLFEEE